MVDNTPEVLRAGGDVTLMIRIPRGRMVVLDKELMDIIYNSFIVHKVTPRQVVSSLNNVLKARNHHHRHTKLVESDLNLRQICKSIEEVGGSQLGSSDPRRHTQEPADLPPDQAEPIYVSPYQAGPTYVSPYQAGPTDAPPPPPTVSCSLDWYYGLTMAIRQEGRVLSFNTNQQRYIYHRATAHDSFSRIADGLFEITMKGKRRRSYDSRILPESLEELWKKIQDLIYEHPPEQGPHWRKVLAPFGTYGPEDQPTARDEPLPQAEPEPELRPAPSAAATEDRPVSPLDDLFLPRSSRPRKVQSGSSSQAETAPTLVQQLAQTQISSSSLAPPVLAGSKRQKSQSPSTGNSSKSSASPTTKPTSSRDDRSRDDRYRDDRPRDDRPRDDRSRDDRPRQDRRKPQKKKRRDDRDSDSSTEEVLHIQRPAERGGQGRAGSRLPSGGSRRHDERW